MMSEGQYRVLCHKYLAEVERQDDEIEQLQSAITSWKEEEEFWKETEANLLARIAMLERELDHLLMNEAADRHMVKPIGNND